MKTNRIKLVFLAGLVLSGVIFSLYFLSKRRVGNTFRKEETLPQQPFEHEEAKPDIRREVLPDGREIEYGTRNGPLSPQREEELRKIIKEQTTNRNLNQNLTPDKGLFLDNTVFAGNAADNLVVEDQTGNPANEDRVREMFTKNEIYWTNGELPKLRKIVVVPELMGGKALGAYDYVKIKDSNGNFQDWQGIIWVVSYSSGGMTVAHEYGHHFTDYWAAMRTDGSWDKWPATQAGDYYQMRPLPEGCHCESYSCPYQLRVWEIIAEDFRHTISKFNDGHMFAGLPCQGGGTIPWPDKKQTAAYIKSLPFNLQITPTITQKLPASTPVLSPTPTIIGGATPPYSSSTPTGIPIFLSCPTGFDKEGKTIKLKLGYPCK